MLECFVRIKLLSWSFTIFIKNPFLLQVTIWSKSRSFEFHRNNIELILKLRALWRSLNSCRTRLSNFFTKPNFWWSDWHQLTDIFLFHFVVGFVRLVLVRCWSSVVERRLQITWSRSVSPLRNSWNQRRTVRFEVDPSSYYLFILPIVTKTLWQSLS